MGVKKVWDKLVGTVGGVTKTTNLKQTNTRMKKKWKKNAHRAARRL